MKKIIFTLVLFAAFSCSKKEETETAEATNENIRLPYDTTAIDSFAPGANPGNVIMERAVVDSAAVSKNEEQQLVDKMKKEEADKKVKQDEETKKKEAEKKKAEEAAKKKKAAEQTKTQISPVMETAQQ